MHARVLPKEAQQQRVEFPWLLLGHPMSRCGDQRDAAQPRAHLPHPLEGSRYLSYCPVFRATDEAGWDIHRSSRERTRRGRIFGVDKNAIGVQSTLKSRARELRRVYIEVRVREPPAC